MNEIYMPLAFIRYCGSVYVCVIQFNLLNCVIDSKQGDGSILSE